MMVARHSPLEQHRQALQIAADWNLDVIERGGRYFVYRKLPGRRVFVARCGNTDSLFRTVSRCAGSVPPKEAA